MTLATFSEFETTMRAAGFADIGVRDYPEATEAANHTHDFAVKALVVRGEMWLTVNGDTRHLVVGDTFEMDHETVHSERYGVDGATYWAARRFQANAA
ncbi:AraC family transcriptional regulator [Variovorax sp. GB1R11]|uniref:AraC family transcriptional regulator n=1 Tax=Variovorax sp. GB1R11 TaxID=3443741 RepID=UPI003F461D6C